MSQVGACGDAHAPESPGTRNVVRIGGSLRCLGLESFDSSEHALLLLGVDEPMAPAPEPTGCESEASIESKRAGRQKGSCSRRPRVLAGERLVV